jgi:lactoylglutathione lyase
MKIEHIAMYVCELELMKDFYCTYFNATAHEKYHNPKSGLETYFLTFEEGARLELMTRPDMGEDHEGLWHLGYTHLAMSLGSKQAVDELTEQLVMNGCALVSPPRITGDGYYESCIKDPEGNQIELTV